MTFGVRGLSLHFLEKIMFLSIFCGKNINFTGKCYKKAQIMLNAFASLKCSKKRIFDDRCNLATYKKVRIHFFSKSRLEAHKQLFEESCATYKGLLESTKWQKIENSNTKGWFTL